MMKKDIFAIIFAVLIVVFVALNIEIQSVEDFYDTQLEVVEAGSETINLSVIGVENMEIIGKTEFVLRENDTVFSVLSRVLRHYRIIFDYRGIFDVYVVSIDGLSEFDFGGASGWLFRVNGEFPSVACNRVGLKNGDFIEFLYSIDGGFSVAG